MHPDATEWALGVLLLLVCVLLIWARNEHSLGSVHYLSGQAMSSLGSVCTTYLGILQYSLSRYCMTL